MGSTWDQNIQWKPVTKCCILNIWFNISQLNFIPIPIVNETVQIKVSTSNITIVSVLASSSSKNNFILFSSCATAADNEWFSKINKFRSPYPQLQINLSSTQPEEIGIES